MAGTRSGALKMWEERRKKYGPSGRRPKSGSESGSHSRKQTASYIIIDDEQVNLSWFTSSRIHAFKQETERMIHDLGVLYRRSPAQAKHLPAYVVEIYKKDRSRLQRWVRQRKAALPQIEEYGRRIENKKHGRRYHA